MYALRYHLPVVECHAGNRFSLTNSTGNHSRVQPIVEQPRNKRLERTFFFFFSPRIKMISDTAHTRHTAKSIEDLYRSEPKVADAAYLQ